MNGSFYDLSTSLIGFIIFVILCPLYGLCTQAQIYEQKKVCFYTKIITPALKITFLYKDLFWEN